MKTLKIIIAVAICMCSTTFTSAQVMLLKDGVTMTDMQEVTKKELESIKIEIPKEEVIEYDKVIIKVEFDNSDMKGLVKALVPTSASSPGFKIYPKEKSLDQVLKDGKIALDLAGEVRAKNTLGTRGSLGMENVKFKIIIEAYYQDGTESYYSESSKTYKTRKIYKFQKKLDVESITIKVIKPKKK